MAKKEVKTVVAAHALIFRPDGRFLLTHRSPKNDYKPNLYDLPGGTVEPGEKSKAAARRETREETKLRIKIHEPIYVHSFMSGPYRHQFQIVYRCTSDWKNVKLNPSEHDGFFWARPKDLIGLPLIAFVKGLLNEVLLPNKQNRIWNVAAGTDNIATKPHGRRAAVI